MSALLSVPEALARILARVEPLPIERVPVALSAGRVVAEDVPSTVDLPPFRSSSMDGFAVRAADVPGSLKIVGEAAAGRPEGRVLGQGEAIAISTGGVVPEGADTVVPVEHTTVGDGVVEIGAAARPGENVRAAGSDIRTGATVMPSGITVSPARVGALAACGVEEISARALPNVTIAVTGTELRQPGEPLGHGEIYESNGVMLAALAVAAGAAVERLAVAEDTEQAHRTALSRALSADVVVSSGGVSVGPHDLVRRIEAELGVEEVFWGVAMRPGKPIAFGVRGATLVFGLPGNPVSSLVGFMLFVRPALRALQGDPTPGPDFRPGILTRAARQRPERDDYVRAQVTFGGEGALVQPIDGQESHMIARTAAANAVVHVPRGSGTLEAGASVRYLVL